MNTTNTSNGILGEVKATIQERVAQSLSSDQKEFFLRIAPNNILLGIESSLTREKKMGGEAVTISPTWEMTLDEAQQYLIDQQGEINAFQKLCTLIEEKDEKFTKDWLNVTGEDKYKTVGHKGSFFTTNEAGEPLDGFNMYIVTNSYVKRNGVKVFTPNYILITPANLLPIEVMTRVEEIIKERKEYANSQNELSEI